MLSCVGAQGIFFNGTFTTRSKKGEKLHVSWLSSRAARNQAAGSNAPAPHRAARGLGGDARPP